VFNYSIFVSVSGAKEQTARPTLPVHGCRCTYSTLTVCVGRSRKRGRQRNWNCSSRSQHTLFTLCHSDKNIIITQSHSSILPTCFTSSLEPASYITQNTSSELLVLLSATFIW